MGRKAILRRVKRRAFAIEKEIAGTQPSKLRDELQAKLEELRVFAKLLTPTAPVSDAASAPAIPQTVRRVPLQR